MYIKTKVYCFPSFFWSFKQISLSYFTLSTRQLLIIDVIILDMHVIYSCHTNVLIYCLIFKQLHKHVEVTVCENLIGRCSSHLVKSLDKTERFIFGKIYMYHVFTLSFTEVSSFSRWTRQSLFFSVLHMAWFTYLVYQSIKNRNVISWYTYLYYKYIDFNTYKF